MSLRFYTATPAPLSRRLFIGGSDVRVIVSGEEAALVRLWHEQNVQMKSQRSLGVISADQRHTHGHVARSSTAQAEHLRPLRVSTRELIARDNGRPLQNQRPS